MNKILLGYIVFYFALQSSVVMGQFDKNQFSDTTYDQSTRKLFDMYSVRIGDFSHILNGPEYFHDDQNVIGNPFFGTKQFYKGSVDYDGTRYENLLIGYDIFRDELFIARYSPNGNLSRIQLSNEKTSGFTLPNNTFIRLKDSIDQKNHPGSGYYDLLYHSEMKVVVKRRKIKESDTDDYYGINNHYSYKFKASDKIYVIKDNSFKHIGSKKTLIRLLADEKRNLRKYYKENWQNLDNLESFVISICKYYDYLKTVSQ